MLAGMFAGSAGGAQLAKPCWGPIMGLWCQWDQWGGNTGAGAGGNFAAFFSAKSVGRCLRPSHSASGFKRHRTRWGDHQPPIPFRRGIPFRGDMLGYAGFGAKAIWGF